jgi:hypothetical protein
MRNQEKKSLSTQRTLIFSGFLVIFVHLVSCIFVFLAEIEPNHNWLKVKIAAL